MERFRNNFSNSLGNANWQRRSLRSQNRQRSTIEPNGIMRKNRKKRNPYVVGFIVFILLYFFVYKPFKLINVRGGALKKSAQQLKKDFAKNDLDLVKKDLDDFSVKYAALEREAKPLYLFAFIPYVGDMKNGLEAGNYMIRAAKESVVAISPYADLIGFKKGEALFVDAKPLLKQLPDILGKDEPKTYLILFQNDKERRATGGFLTSYAVFNIDKGRIKKESSDDIYQLDNSLSSHPRAPREILAYHKVVSQFVIRDSNLSPDFVESIKLFNSLYQKSPKKVDYDGIITLDSKVLVDMLTIFGDTEAGGVVWNAKEDKRCDCPQVIYTLFDIVDRPVNYVKEDRKGILGQLMQALLLKVLGFSPSRYWGPFIENSIHNLDTKHILVHFPDKTLQESIEKLNYGGRIRQFNGDYLHINNVNFAGAKSNLFVNETVESKTTFKGNTVEREVLIDWRNPYPHSDCNLERGGLCLNAQLRNWIRIYVPKGSKLVEFIGSETPVKTYDELGKTVFEGFLRVNPLGKATVQVTYTLPDGISANNYELLVQKQPSVDTLTLKALIKGKTVYNQLLDKDVVITD